MARRCFCVSPKLNSVRFALLFHLCKECIQRAATTVIVIHCSTNPTTAAFANAAASTTAISVSAAAVSGARNSSKPFPLSYLCQPTFVCSLSPLFQPFSPRPGHYRVITQLLPLGCSQRGVCDLENANRPERGDTTAVNVQFELWDESKRCRRTHAHTYIHARIYTHVYTRTHVYTHPHTSRVRIATDINACTYARTCIHARAHARTHARVYTHAHLRQRSLTTFPFAGLAVLRRSRIGSSWYRAA